MSKRLIAIITTLAALVPAGAQAETRSELAGPWQDGCIGLNATARGEAWSDDPGITGFRWDLEGRPVGGSSWTFLRSGTNMVQPSNPPGVLGDYAADALPSPAEFRLVLTIDKASGGSQVTSSMQSNVSIDKTRIAPPVIAARATSRSQALFTWTAASGGNGCAGSGIWTSLTNGSWPAVTGFGSSASGVQSDLNPGSTYRYTATSRNFVGNASAPSGYVEARTRTDTKVVLAGQVTGYAGKPLFGINVSVPGASTITDPEGWYRLPLAANSYTVQFGPGCAFYGCTQGYSTTTVPVTVSGFGVIQRLDKTMTIGG